MSTPRNNISNTPEGIATYNQIISQDETAFPDGNIPLIYTPTQTKDKSSYWNEDLFEVLNKQIANVDEDLPLYNYKEDSRIDQKKNTFLLINIELFFQTSLLKYLYFLN